jgi:HAD superfamily hydrolase (TIGR01509 family)
MRAVIFDMDGVLVDSEAVIAQAACAMFRELGVTVQPSDFVPFIGAGEYRYVGGVAEKYGVKYDPERAKDRTYGLYLELAPRYLKAFPGARELVAACRAQGWPCAVASSAHKIKVDANLHALALPPGILQTVLTAEDVPRPKPAPDLFLKAAERLGVAPSECTVIEDAVNGVVAAKAAGMRCVAVTSSFPADKLALADCVRPSIAEVTLADVTG